MKVLVGITTRNRAKILPRAIQSALKQNYPDIKVAVFNDASTDETYSLTELFPQVHWIHSKVQRGYVYARNFLMKEYDADLYVSLDDDAWFVQDDEIVQGVDIFRRHTNIAALAYDILSPDKPEHKHRSAPYPTHLFIGCGHMLRVSAAKSVGYYTLNPGSYGSEEKELCLQFLDKGYEILHLPGVHVWHDKTPIERDLKAQHRSSVCNQLAFTLRRCPMPMVFWLLPANLISHLKFAITHHYIQPGLMGIADFMHHFPTIIVHRQPVKHATFREFRCRSRMV